MTTRAATVLGLLALVLLAITGLGVAHHGREHGWWGTSDAQRALEADPMASTSIAGHTAVAREVPETVGPVGKWPGPSVRLWFPGGEDLPTTVAALATAAEQAGWVEDRTLSTPTSWYGTRDAADGTAVLTVSPAPAGPPGAPPRSASTDSPQVLVSLAMQ